jgi:hypothetical protein
MAEYNAAVNPAKANGANITAGDSSYCTPSLLVPALRHFTARLHLYGETDMPVPAKGRSLSKKKLDSGIYLDFCLKFASNL